MSTTPPTPLVGSLDLATLATGYRDGALTPSLVATAVLARVAASGQDAIWINRVPEFQVMARAAALEALSAGERAALPLYGVPFAIKDNIDMAGMPTTAACPDFTQHPDQTATATQRLLDAGAILIGKTNLDQFATGLVGVRSPYGVPRNPFDPARVPGGSSSGSAVAVSTGLVSFALGTDTAGSGRVPAAFNNIVGLKPTKGLISTTGVVPACRSLDCVSVFALTVEDAMDVFAVAASPDPTDPFSRTAPAMPPAFHTPWRFGTPRPDQLRFFGDAEAERQHAQALARMEALGGVKVEIDFAPFAEAAALLYSGPWVAERTAAVGDFIAANPNAALPVTAGIIEGGWKRTAVDAFRAQYQLARLRAETDVVWRDIDVLVVPTAGTTPTIAQVMADPVGVNTNMGQYTNFTNLLDLCGIAVPAGFTPDGLPVGITLLAPAFREVALATLAAAVHQSADAPLGASGYPMPPPRRACHGEDTLTRLFVVGGHLSGQPLNHQLTSLGARFIEACDTAPLYRFHALPGSPPRPGMVKVALGGVAIEGEIWGMTAEAFGRFVDAIPEPLGVGTVTLADGRKVRGFLCESAGLEGAEDISRFGGWRAYRASLG